MADFRDFTEPPFFIVGVPRSGTTMLRLMLNNHPRLAIPFESGFIPTFYRRLEAYGDLRDRDNRRRILEDICGMHEVRIGKLVPDLEAVLSQPIAQYSDLVAAIFAAHAIKQGKPRWGDKTPAYIEHIEILATLFPSARVIHIIRDGRDVAVSCRRVGWFPRSIPYLAQRWSRQTVVAHKMGVLLGPERYMELRFEDLALQPERVLKTVCEFIGEAYDPAMLAFEDTARQQMPENSEHWHATSMSKPDPEKRYEWKHKMSRADRTLFEKYSRTGLETFGYELEGRPMTPAVRLKELYYATLARW